MLRRITTWLLIATLWRIAALLRRRTAVLAWLRLSVRLLAVALLRWAAVAALRRRHAAGHVPLLVLGVVAGVDGAEDEFDHPEVGGEVDGGHGAGHFGGFVFVVLR